MVAISYGKGVIICQKYNKMNGDCLKHFGTENFNDMFIKSENKDGRLFIQNGDPSQNSKLAKKNDEVMWCRIVKNTSIKSRYQPNRKFFSICYSLN